MRTCAVNNMMSCNSSLLPLCHLCPSRGESWTRQQKGQTSNAFYIPSPESVNLWAAGSDWWIIITIHGDDPLPQQCCQEGPSCSSAGPLFQERPPYIAETPWKKIFSIAGKRELLKNQGKNIHEWIGHLHPALVQEALAVGRSLVGHIPHNRPGCGHHLHHPIRSVRMWDYYLTSSQSKDSSLSLTTRSIVSTISTPLTLFWSPSTSLRKDCAYVKSLIDCSHLAN